MPNFFSEMFIIATNFYFEYSIASSQDVCIFQKLFHFDFKHIPRTFTCLKTSIETLEIGEKYVQS